MKKLVIIGNLLSAIPALIIVPLAPFVFILIHTEGKIPGYSHEYATQALTILYPIILIVCLFTSIKLFKNDKKKAALWISIIPLTVFGLLFLVFYFGDIVLR